MSFRVTAVLAIGFFCALAVSPAAQAAVYTLQPDEAASKDTFVYQFSMLANTNMDVTPYNEILGVSNTPTGHTLTSLIQFDLSSLIGAGVTAADVSSATMRLYSTTNSLGGGSPSATYPVTIDVYGNDSAWDESTVSWNTRPGVDALSGIFASSVVATSDGWIDFDLTSLVQDWVDGSVTNVGMQLTQAAEVQNDIGQRVGATFVASSGVAALRPILEITTVPEPSGMFLLAAAGLLAMRFRRRR